MIETSPAIFHIECNQLKVHFIHCFNLVLKMARGLTVFAYYVLYEWLGGCVEEGGKTPWGWQLALASLSSASCPKMNRFEG